MDVSDIIELTLETTDLDALEAFYVEAFDLAVLSRTDTSRWLKLGERTRLGIWSPGPKEHGDRGGRHVHFAMSATPERLDRILARLRGPMGLEVEGPVEHEGGDRSIYLRDPVGNLIEVWDFLERRGTVIDDLGAS